MTQPHIRAIALDVNETLCPLDPLGVAFTWVGLEAAAVPLWFARLLRDGFALAAIGVSTGRSPAWLSRRYGALRRTGLPTTPWHSPRPPSPDPT